MSDTSSSDLPYLIAGPMLRRVDQEQVVVWLVTSEPLQGRFQLYQGDSCLADQPCEEICHSVQVGERAFIHLIRYQPHAALPHDCWLSYDLQCQVAEEVKNLAQLAPHLLYEGEQRISFVYKPQLDHVLHGSCRKPHYASEDALLRVDQQLASTTTDATERPALLMMSGDQIYADDVAGPTLSAIHQSIELLGLFEETIPGATVANTQELIACRDCYYQREALLPQTEANQALKDRFFAGAMKPIFTADTAHNHLITLSEVIAMYLLVWSPVLWQRVRLNATIVEDQHVDLFIKEQREIEHFTKGLDKVQRALAHLPVYMIFDDHDVTDDWNLTRGWEEAAYGHAFSRSIIGNSLIGYWLCQGWGNAPEYFPENWKTQLENRELEALTTEVLEFEHWHYTLATSPKMVVLDTRTKRWWSESNPGKPSGLMDWEALSDLQQELVGEPSVLLVSPAPIFGMKLVEIVQRIFTYFGHALMVDAENWMAHSGSANVILNIFRHTKTPQYFVILSGDVHYSFAYDIKLRFRKNSPDIWQITCSGFKNEFPHKLLRAFDRFNRWLYGVKSPLTGSPSVGACRLFHAFQKGSRITV